VEIHISALDVITLPGLKVNLQVQIPRPALATARLSLTLEADLLAFADALGKGDVQGPLPYPGAAVRPQFRVLVRNLPPSAPIGVLEVDINLGVGVIAPGVSVGLALSRAAKGGKPSPPEQTLKKLAEGRAIPGAGAVELETLIPVRRRPEVLTLAPAAAQLVIGGALFGITEHLVGLTQLLEAQLGVGLLAHVRVVLAGQLAVGPLDLVLAGVTRHPQNLIVVFEFHGVRTSEICRPGGTPLTISDHPRRRQCPGS